MPEITNPNLQAQGPNGGGRGDMSSMLAIMILAMAILFGYQYFFAKPPVDTQTGQAQNQPVQSVTQSAPAPAAGQPASVAAPQPLPETPVITAASESFTTVENSQYRIVFTNRGAQVKSWLLKNYTDSQGKPLDMVQKQASDKFGYPLSLFTYDPTLTTQLNQALYEPSVTGTITAPGSISFHYAANGIDVVKTFRFDASYVVGVDAEVKRNGLPVRALVQWPAGLGDMEEFVSSNAKNSSIIPTSTSSVFTWSINGKQDSTKAKDVHGNDTLNEPYEYAAVTDLYFAAAFLPSDPADTSVVTLHNAIDLPSDPSDPKSKIIPAPVLGLAIGGINGSTHVRLYAGPKELDLLKTIHAIGPDGKATGQSLAPLIQLGWLKVIALPLYIALRFLHDHLGQGGNNWGWAIMIFTAVFTTIMLPLRFMAMRSSLKMMRLQPKVEAIKNRYKNLKVTDPKRTEMNTEMMALYQKEGVNMYGSCLPMLPQMPLFIAYYSVLRNAVELRHAHWFWLTDLSISDPYYILPGIIIVSMFLTQIITPSPGMDPTQRKMMAFMMPIMMGFMFGHLASGLALYMCTSYLINLALQLAVNQSSMGQEMHAISAKRAAKRDGNGPSTIKGRR